jgi:ABC-type multidrug transport system fused ATPase/permease subunit
MRPFGFTTDENLINRALKLLVRKDKLKVFGLASVQIVLSVLDLIGILLVGVISLLATNNELVTANTGSVHFVLNSLGLQKYSVASVIQILGIISVLMLTMRTLFSVLIAKKTFSFLAKKSETISENLAKNVFSQDILTLRKVSSQELAYAITTGVEKATVGIIGTSVNLMADFAVVMILFAGLSFVNLPIAISVALYFSIIGFSIHRKSSKRARAISSQMTSLNILCSEKIVEAISNFRDLVVRNNQNFYLDIVRENRRLASNFNGQMAFVPYVGKYIIESSIVIGSFLLSLVLFQIANPEDAIATLSVFLVASYRIAPSVLRLQQGLLQIAYCSGLSKVTLVLHEQLTKNQEKLTTLESISPGNESEFIPTIQLKNLDFSYGGEGVDDNNFRILIPNLHIEPGEFVAVVGPSGAGKSTLVDIILGLIPVTAGSILISGKPPLDVYRRYPGLVGYVPQDVVIINGTLAENIRLGFPRSKDSELELNAAISKSRLETLVSTLDLGTETDVGEWGQYLSGGQRQRLGLARSFYTKPKLLVLDEATSSLDAETENLLVSDILNLRGKSTLVVIAHRLATVRFADKVIYMEDGKVLKSGTFEEVRQAIPNFDNQARLLGL